NRFEKDGMLRLAQSIAGDGLFQANGSDNVARLRLREFLASLIRISMNVVKLGQNLLAIFAGIPHSAISLESARVNANEIKLTVRRRHYLEYETAKRLFGIRLASFFLVRLARIGADDRWPIDRAGQIPANRIPERLDANVLAP